MDSSSVSGDINNTRFKIPIRIYVMKKLVLVLMTLLSIGVSSASYAGCQHDWDRASDGSRCGGRSSDSRPGGD